MERVSPFGPAQNEGRSELVAVLQQYDEDGDGKLSPSELQRLKEDFKLKQGPAYNLLTTRYLKEGEEELLDIHIRHFEDDLHTTDTALRYAAYTGLASRVARYLAFTSDFGEAFRPVAHPMFVKASYGVSWCYIGCDVAFETYRNFNNHGMRGPDLAISTVKRAGFQAMASMFFPMFTIHTVVHQSKKMFKKMGRFQVWGPTACGLGVVPFLPYMFDHPFEWLFDEVFDRVWPGSNPKFHTGFIASHLKAE